MTTEAEVYFTEGCGRCKLGGTPDCKVHHWPDELVLLRQIVLECGLKEDMKWGMPCYTHQEKNIVVIAAFKGHCSLSFFKGALLSDTHGILEKAGENTVGIRLIKFNNTKKISQFRDVIKACIFETIELEKSGAKLTPKKAEDYPHPDELTQKFENMPDLKTAFEALTPGRQRAYLLHFSQPKQTKTREVRIEKCIPLILSGKGLNE